MLEKVGDKKRLIGRLIKAFEEFEEADGLNILQFFEQVRDYEFTPDVPVYSYYFPLEDMMSLTENKDEVDWEDSAMVIKMVLKNEVYCVDFVPICL